TQYAGSPPGNLGEPGASQERANMADEPVVRVILGEAGRAKDRHAGAHEVERPEAADELHEDSGGPHELEASALRAPEEAEHFGAVGARAPPAGRPGLVPDHGPVPRAPVRSP